ncbi:MAG: tRNA lysidine(34) synthetase TilS [Allopontixanthobacter sediminis]
MDRSIDPQLIERFRSDLETVWPDRGEGSLALAVSGGPDSTALLLLAHAAMAGRIEAATVDHGLREGAAVEAEMVAAFCAELEVPHRTLRVHVGPGNMQDSARRARYLALADWAKERGLAALATAHHADDQAETLLMRLNRGSGVAGLAGVRPRGLVPGSGLVLLRPLLGWRREELGRVVRAADAPVANDPSNADERFDRVRLRRALTDADWIDSLAVAASAGHLADADAALDWTVDREWLEAVTEVVDGLRYVPVAPRAVRIRIVARIISQLGEMPRGGATARLVDLLEVGSAGSLGGVLAKVENEIWHFVREPKIRKN